jgi:2-polyprenyl-6-methoxyphenol hydroxylase-like FAD-dependent oxidoreductase
MVDIDNVLVVGGGVAGLTTAAALHKHGFATGIVERDQTWHALGAGFLVHANGIRILRGLGLATGVENAGALEYWPEGLDGPIRTEQPVPQCSDNGR